MLNLLYDAHLMASTMFSVARIVELLGQATSQEVRNVQMAEGQLRDYEALPGFYPTLAVN